MKVKPYIQLAESAGLEVEQVVQGRHLKLLCATSDGRKAAFVVARSPSDHRARLNCLTQMRRFARGVEADEDPRHRNTAPAPATDDEGS